MFLVLDVTKEPEAEDRERGWIRPEALVHLALKDAIDDLIERIRFSLGYELDTELEQGEPELPADVAAAIDGWRDEFDRDELGRVGELRILTRDYRHVLIPMGVSP
jgi:hypothetical protein